MAKKLPCVITLGLVAACGPGYPDNSSDFSVTAPVGIERAAAALSTLTVAPIFGANMVLQRETTVPIFGTAAAGAAVTVDFQGQHATAVANTLGQWTASLAPMPASTSPAAMTISSGSASLVLSEVQVGEVWLCSGQSNMGKPLSYADGSAPYIADAGNHNLRLFRMTGGSGPSTTTWQTSNPTTAASFSAVCYWMGLDLSFDLGVPIGLIQATDDGSNISEWQHTNGGTGVAYDAMVAPIQPLAIKAVLWYQGESNGGDVNYQTKLTDMLAEWRGAWALPALPFGIVQLPAAKWTAARSAQYNVSRIVANTYLVVTSDLPGSTQLHPTAKYLVGMRSSIGARGAVYGEPVEFSGPVPAPTSYVSGRTVVLDLAHVGNGLSTSDGLAPGTFQLAGATGNYVSATATIVGNTIQVTASRISAPRRVRYGWSGAGNLRNAVSIPTEGGAKTVSVLPASLFQVNLP